MVSKYNYLDTMKFLFYLVLTASFVLFTWNYAFTDWEEVSSSIEDSTMQLLEGIHCEIDFLDFHYKGLCTDREEIFELMSIYYSLERNITID